jgi:protein-tyrosine phosphatase
MSENSSVSPLDRLLVDGFDVCADVHCHCLPAIDDGPNDLDEAVQLCRLLVRDGMNCVVASPHQLGKYDLGNSRERIERRLEALRKRLAELQIPLELAAGADVRIDERLPTFVADGTVTTIGDLHRHLLLELPTTVFCDPTTVIEQLLDRGVQPIMTHPERHRYLGGNAAIVANWVRAGAVVQVTAGSLVGDFGQFAFDFAWRLVQHGLVHLVASDAHDSIRRPPRMTAALKLLTQHAGRPLAARICAQNPRLVWRGEHIPTAKL